MNYFEIMKEYRVEISFLRELKAVTKTGMFEGIPVHNVNVEILKELVKEKTKKVRQYRDMLNPDRPEDDWKSHGEDYDRRYSKKVLPYEMTTEQAEQYREEEWWHWYNPYEDGRDCTGVWFTSAIKIFPVAGKTFIYHFQNCDV